ncbi:hypothetical protein MWU50_04245 [Flavobacteriaceae bacterium S0862]|nr:hypothetical protein [Flavobacteriaceae bacterium S0862]
MNEKGKQCLIHQVNGYMFSLFNKNCEIGIRFSKEVQEKYIKEFNSSIYKSYGTVIKVYVLILEAMFKDLDNFAKYLDESYDYVMSLDLNRISNL